MGMFLSSGRAFCLVVSAVQHTGGPRVDTAQGWGRPVHLKRCLGMQKSRCVASNRGEVPRRDEGMQDNIGKPYTNKINGMFSHI